MAMFDFNSITNLLQANHSRIQLFAAFGLGLIGVTLIASDLSLRPAKKIIKSPQATLLPRLAQSEIDSLPYPPDVLPGLRDVATPYGTMRVYEWGPEDGKKVLFIHGISTPCLALGGVAHGLAEKGCRVMLFGMSIRLHSMATAATDHSPLSTIPCLELCFVNWISCCSMFTFISRIIKYLTYRQIYGVGDTQMNQATFPTIPDYTPLKSFWH